MNSKKRITISWSGGKDSAFALYKILTTKEFEVVSLYTVVDEETKRVGLHGVHEKLIEKQAEHIGLPLQKIYLSASENHDAYEKLMRKFYEQSSSRVEGVLFGDIFLEDLKKYRLELLKSSKLFAEFPLWNMDSKILVTDFINVGFKSVLCAADANLFTENEVGVLIDNPFLESLSAAIDPCGENGEFHSFVYDGPIFKKPVLISKGEVVKKSYTYHKKNEAGELIKLESAFWFQDLNLVS